MELKEYIEREGLSVHAFAKKAGVTPSTVYKFLSGAQVTVKPAIAQKIAEATGGAVCLVRDILFKDKAVEINFRVKDE